MLSVAESYIWVNALGQAWLLLHILWQNTIVRIPPSETTQKYHLVANL